MSKLITMYFPKDEAPGYRKAVIDRTEIPFFRELGAVTAEELTISKKAEKVVISENTKGPADDKTKSGSK